MLQRYQRKDGRELLVEALKRQDLLQDDETLATKLVDKVSLQEWEPRKILGSFPL